MLAVGVFSWHGRTHTHRQPYSRIRMCKITYMYIIYIFSILTLCISICTDNVNITSIFVYITFTCVNITFIFVYLTQLSFSIWIFPWVPPPTCHLHNSDDKNTKYLRESKQHISWQKLSAQYWLQNICNKIIQQQWTRSKQNMLALKARSSEMNIDSRTETYQSEFLRLSSKN